MLRPAILTCLLIFSLLCFSQTWTKQTGTGAEIGNNKDGGAVWGDYDNDGDLDLLVNTNWNNTSGRTRLLRSDGAANPSFTDVTNADARGLRSTIAERSILWGDLNNDGYLDIIRNAHSDIEIYINRGSPNFNFGVGGPMNPNLTITQLSIDGCLLGAMD